MKKLALFLIPLFLLFSSGAIFADMQKTKLAFKNAIHLYSQEKIRNYMETVILSHVMSQENRAGVPPAETLPVARLKAAQTSGQIITVTTKNLSDFNATLNAYELQNGVWAENFVDFPAVGGSRGLMHQRKQNTYTSPVGNWGFVFGFGHMDNPGLHPDYEYRQTTQDSYWVTDPNSPHYNRWIEGKGDFKEAEHLVQFGAQYDYALVMDFNYAEPVKGDGAAIFLHIATPDGKGTAGCIAVSKENLLEIMRWLNPEKNPRIIVCLEGDLENY